MIDHLPDNTSTCVSCGRSYWPTPRDGGQCGVCQLDEPGDADEAQRARRATDNGVESVDDLEEAPWM